MKLPLDKPVQIASWSTRDVAAFLIKKSRPNYQHFLDSLVDGLTLTFLTYEELIAAPFSLPPVKARVLLSLVASQQ